MKIFPGVSGSCRGGGEKFLKSSLWLLSLRKPPTLILLTLFLGVVVYGICRKLLRICNLDLPRQSPQIETLLYVLASRFVLKTLSIKYE